MNNAVVFLHILRYSLAAVIDTSGYQALIYSLTAVIAVLFAIVAVLLYIGIKRVKHYERLSETDDATGIGNRLHLARRFDEIPPEKRSEYAMVCYYLDSERTERAFGHEGMLEYIRNAIESVRTYATDDDVFTRVYGGGVAVLAHVTDDQIHRGVMLIIDQIRNYKVKEDALFTCNVAAGIYRLKETDDNVHEAVFNAWRTAEQTAKAGGDYAFCTDNMVTEFVEERNLRSDILKGFENREFVTYIQFCVDTDTARIVGGEALARWHHPDRGLIPPYKFIPYMEREDMIDRIDFYNLEEVCKFLSEIYSKGVSDFYISCNFSRKTFSSERFVSDCLSIIEKYDFPMSMIAFEITESDMAKNVVQVNANATDLKQLGIKIMLDDFGEGFASFYDLHEYPIDALKLDKALVDNYNTKKGNAILRGMTRMGHELNLTVVVEGVENDAQVRELRNIKCDIIQGFHFHRPIPVWEAGKKLLEDVAQHS